MLIGISTRWKQTLPYHLNGESVKGEVLMRFINFPILPIFLCLPILALIFVCVTSDMGPSNRASRKDFSI